ncbi:MAG: rhodanese-like domain-containing protein [Halobacteriota archaeon]
MADEIDADTLQRLLASDEDVVVVDVRPAVTFATGHIPGSENVPFERLLDELDTVDWGERVVFVCPYGERSRQAAELVGAYEGLEPGTEVYNLTDGLLGWDGPLVTADTS